MKTHRTQLFGRIRRASSALLLTCALLPVAALTPATASAEDKNASIDLALYGELLEKHTKNSPDLVGVRVDYAGIGGDARWPGLVRQVKAAKPSRLTASERMAFWINAYNILTIDLIRENYPVAGIKDIGSFFSPVWDIPVAKIEGRSVSLGQIEHEILRKLNEPRIHAAIVCASASCPPLARTPFRPAQLDADLDAAMRAWLSSDKKGVRIDRKARRVQISKIFDWFEEDFEAGGGALSTIARFVPEADASWLRQNRASASVTYFGYDWTLNDLRP